MYILKPKILTRFLMRRFFASFFLVMLTICGIIFSVTFVERLSSNPDAISTAVDAWGRLLGYIPMFLPMTVFMCTLVAFYNLTKSTESMCNDGKLSSMYESKTSSL